MSTTTMTITLMPLPYDRDALEPAISAATLEKHHGAHHKGYVEKVNRLTRDTALAGERIEAIITAARKSGDKQLFNQAAQVWNHGFYWHSLSPKGGKPDAKLATAIEAAFGSLDALHTELAAAATDHFGSGWAWLVDKGGKLAVTATHDADTPADGDANPLLVIDLWEHAYYLDRQNQRKAYVDAVIAKLLNWEFAGRNYARGKPWTYPA